MRRIGLFDAAVVVAAAGMLACGGGDSPVTPRPRTVVGVFSLVSINGLGTPYLLASDDTAQLELMGSTMTLGADSTFSEVFSVRLTAPQGVQTQTDTSRGVFHQVGTTLTFQPNDGTAMYHMEVTDEHTLTENDPGFLLVYRRN